MMENKENYSSPLAPLPSSSSTPSIANCLQEQLQRRQQQQLPQPPSPHCLSDVDPPAQAPTHSFHYPPPQGGVSHPQVPSSVSSHNIRHFQQEHPRSAPAKPTVLNLSVASPASYSSHRKSAKVYTTAGSSRSWARTPSPVKSFCTPLGTPDLDERGSNGAISSNEPRSKSARTFYSSKCPSSPIKVRSAILQIVKLPDGTEEAVVKRTPEEKHRSPFTLSLNRCNLHQCPVILDECGLQVICYRYNHIVEIDNMSQMKLLYALDLTANHIAQLSNLYTFTNLKVLIVAQNRLSSLDGIECLESLEILDVSANQLRCLPESAHLTRLHTLNIAENRVANLKNVWHFPNLVEINAKRNLIKQLGGVEFLDRLHKLFLSCNQIESLDALGPLSECGELCELTLNGCPVAQLPNYRHHVIANVGNIKYFDYKPVLDDEKRSIRLAIRREEQRRIFVDKMDLFEKTVSRVRLSCKSWWTALEPHRVSEEVEQARRCGIGVFVHSEAEMRCDIIMPTPGPAHQTTPTQSQATPPSATSRASSGTRHSSDRATILEELTHKICDMAAFQLLQLSEEYEKLSLWGPASLLSALVSPVVIYDHVQTLVLHCALLTQGDTFNNLLTVLPNLAELLIEDCALRTLGDLSIVCDAITRSADHNKVCSLMITDIVTRTCQSATILAIRCLPNRIITFNSNVVTESQREAALRCFPSKPQIIPSTKSETTAKEAVAAEGSAILATCVTRTQALYNASILLENMLILSPANSRENL